MTENDICSYGHYLNMRNFSKDEREAIREELLEAGQEIVSIHGFQKTTISDITEPVGIAKGTFYHFFDSKSDFYLKLIAREHDHRFDRIEAELDNVTDPTEGLKQLFSTWAHEVENDLFSAQDMSDLRKPFDRSHTPDWDAEYERFGSRIQLILDTLREQTGEGFPDLTSEQLLYHMEAIQIVVYFMDHFHDADTTPWDSSALYDHHIPALAKGLTVN